MESNELISSVIQNWFQDKFLEIIPVLSGTSCDTFIVQTCGTKYILRGFSSLKQAEQEADILTKLNEIGVSPEIISTKNGTYYVKHKDVYYNLQRNIVGTKPDFSNEAQIIASSVTIARMHKKLSDTTCKNSRTDRFDTIEMIRKVSSFPMLSYLFPENVATQKERVQFINDLESQLRSDQLIHGDLGQWNMIWDGARIWIIDFGECRFGDQHFDLAAAVSCILSRSENQREFYRRFSLFKNEYEKNYHAIDLRKLHLCLYIWLLRGALASLIYIQDTEKQRDSFSTFCLEISKLEKFYEGL